MTYTHTHRLTVVLDKYHWMLYFLVTAMYPRFLITLNEELKSFPVTVRVGQVCSVSFLRSLSTDPSAPVGRRCCWTSRQAKNDLRLPNTLDASPAGHDGACRACNGRIYVLRARARGICYTEKESRLGKRRQDGVVMLSYFVSFLFFPLHFSFVLSIRTLFYFLVHPSSNITIIEGASFTMT